MTEVNCWIRCFYEKKGVRHLISEYKSHWDGAEDISEYMLKCSKVFMGLDRDNDGPVVMIFSPHIDITTCMEDDNVTF